MPAPDRSRSRFQTPLHVGLLVSLLVATMAIAVNHAPHTLAQASTPVASGVGCAPPVDVPLPSVPAQVANPGNGTPVAAVAADATTDGQIRDLVDSLAACLTAGNAETVAELVTDRYLADAYGAGQRMTREDYLALAPSAPIVPVSVVSIGQVDLASGDTATAQVITVQGNQLRTENWTFLFRRNRQIVGTPTAGSGEGHWLVHQVQVLPSAPPQGASEMKAVQSDYAVTLTPSTVKGPNLVVTVQNTGKETHEFLALQLGDGASTDQLIRPTSDTFPANIRIAGQETVPPGETRTLVFLNLEPGTYTVVCLLPDADGVPHLALGETATFTVS